VRKGIIGTAAGREQNVHGEEQEAENKAPLFSHKK